MATDIRSQLVNAQKHQTLVHFNRPFDDGCTEGYVLDVGPIFFLMLFVDGAARYNGFSCYRIRDVRNLEAPARYEAFTKKALRMLGERRPPRPRISVASVEALLKTAGRAFPLVTIHREKADNEVCYIGKVLQAANGRLTMLEIRPGAIWETSPRHYRINQITLIEFAGDYERALHVVGGPAPKRKQNSR